MPVKYLHGANGEGIRKSWCSLEGINVWDSFANRNCVFATKTHFICTNAMNVLDPPKSEFQELGDIYSKELSECKTSCDDFEMEPLFRLVTKMWINTNKKRHIFFSDLNYDVRDHGSCSYLDSPRSKITIKSQNMFEKKIILEMCFFWNFWRNQNKIMPSHIGCVYFII